MKNYLSEISKIQSDGTFYTVRTQFSQLWTIILVIDRHALPGIHCLMTSKDQELYTAILAKIHSLVPDFIPEISISDWEPAPRNALKEMYLTIQNEGCWFHFTQRIWAKTQKLGLVHRFHHNPGITTNNAAESYHAKLKSIIKTPHPRIWNFPTTLNN